MFRDTILRSVLVVAMLLILAGPVMAGGWAVVTVDSLPKDVNAGDNVHLELMVRQHGEKPIHYVDFMNGEALTPFLLARNEETGETVRAEAQRAEEVGRFTVDVVFPSEGTWQWEITPYPLEGTIQLEPLIVLAPAAVAGQASDQLDQASAPSEAATPGADVLAASAMLRWTAMVLLIASAGMAILAVRQRREQMRPLASRPE